MDTTKYEANTKQTKGGGSMKTTLDQRVDAFEVALLAREIDESALVKIFYMMKGIELVQGGAKNESA